MGIIDKLTGTDINKEVERFRKTPGAVLLDVRTEDEYKKAHIPGSINIPEGEVQKLEMQVADRNTPVFIYCLSGAKSWNAVNKLKELGYTNLKNIGGINKYTGKTESSLD